MTWHLKDRELEKKLIAIDPDFIENLQKKEVVGTKAYSIHFGDYVLSGSIGSPRFYAYFDKSELEDVPKYNPNAWNEYPKVTPPENIPMRVETESGGYIYRECAIFNEGVWKCERDGNAEEELYGHVKRFRPWSDD